MKLFDPDPALRWLFCLTHPDDEIAIVGWIARLTHAGAEVHLSWTHDTPERADEARNAARLLGVPAANLHFHHGPDRVLADHMIEALPGLEAMVGALKPARIVVGAFEQGHLDHDATNYMVHRVVASLGDKESRPPVFEIPLYYAYCQPIPAINRFANSDGEERLVLGLGEIELKKRVAQAYPSQNIWGNLVWYRLLQMLRGDREPAGAVERMRVQTHFDFGRPNLPPGLARRVLRTSRWRRWEAALARAEQAFGRRV